MRASPDLDLVASIAVWAHNLREPYSSDYRLTGSNQVTSSDNLTARYNSKCQVIRVRDERRRTVNQRRRTVNEGNRV